MGAARTATCARRETASNEKINIYRGLLDGEWVEDQLDNPIVLDVILYLRQDPIIVTVSQ